MLRAVRADAATLASSSLPGDSMGVETDQLHALAGSSDLKGRAALLQDYVGGD